jgi:hypothetical protein
MATGTWTPAPSGQVLLPGPCLARDSDGQGCTRGLVHRGNHQSTGLRAWLEAERSTALIRAYDSGDGDRLEAMEAPLFEQFGFRPIVRQDLERTVPGGIDWDQARFVGPLLAPNTKVRIHLRLVCFARANQK